jgi:shikimate kinase/3-dehydroquinate synthase
MDVVLIGAPGSGKTAVGRLLARRTGAELVDLDAEVERAAGATVADVFDREGEIGFRARERMAIQALGAGDGSARCDADAGSPPSVRRVIATGGGAIVDPRNRWDLFRGRRVLWLDAPVPTLLKRLSRGAPRPLLAVADPVARLEALIAERVRFYRAGERVDAAGSPDAVSSRVEALLTTAAPGGSVLVDAPTPIGRFVLGIGHRDASVAAVLRAMGAHRCVFVSEPEAWRRHGMGIAAAIPGGGVRVDHVLMRRGERAKTLAAWGAALRDLARLGLERADPVIAVGGGALGDAAGFAAATYLRGVPLIHVPTTLLAQIDSAIGGKTALDLPEGKNLVGAFHQPEAMVLDLELLGTLPERQRRAALGEAVKMALLGDERLLEVLETSGPAIVRGDDEAALAEVVERCAWRKLEIASSDEREAGLRTTLNLGHTIGHGIEAAAGFRDVLHGEAVALGLRGVLAMATAMGIVPPERRERAERLLDAIGFAPSPRTVTRDDVRQAMARDKTRADGRQRWVMPTATGAEVRSDIPDAVVEQGLAAALR